MTNQLRPGRASLTDGQDEVRRAHYAAVARVYLDAGAAGKPPVRAVENEFGAPRSTAVRWVYAARKRGLLSPTRSGERNSRNAKAVAVAAAIGVGYDDLVTAVMEHADGRLRLR